MGADQDDYGRVVSSDGDTEFGFVGQASAGDFPGMADTPIAAIILIAIFLCDNDRASEWVTSAIVIRRLNLAKQ